MAQLGWSVTADGDWLAAGANQDNANVGLVALYLNPQSVSVQPNQEIPGPEVPLNDLHHGDQLPGGKTVAVLSGGNIDPAVLRALLADA